MISVTKTFEWDMGHRVPNHKSLCKNPHGHRYRLEVVVSGPVINQKGSSQQGMILDFDSLKGIVTKEVISKLDHSFMYWKEDKVIDAFAQLNSDLRMLRVPFIPTAECIVQYIASQLSGIIPNKIEGIKLKSLVLYETPTSKVLWESS